MSFFDPKEFYEDSMQHDPALTTSSRNFEFQYTQPDVVERAIQRVKESSSGANLKQKKATMLSRLREADDDVKIGDRTMDADIDTRMSMIARGDISDDDILHSPNYEAGDCVVLKDCKSESNESIDMGKTRRVLAGEVNAALNDEAIDRLDCADEEKLQWAPIGVRLQKTSLQRLQEEHAPKSSEAGPSNHNPSYPSASATQESYQRFQELYQKNMLSVQAAMGVGLIPMNAGFPCFSPFTQPPFANIQNGNMFNMAGNNNSDFNDYNPNAYLVEDSDLEEEMAQRPKYEGLYRERPSANLPTPDDEEHGFAEFINIEPEQPYLDMSYLKSTVPMRFSGQTSPEGSEMPPQSSKEMRVVINKRNDNGEGDADKSSEVLPKKKTVKVIQKRVIKVPKAKVEKTTTTTTTTTVEREISGPSTSRKSREANADTKKRTTGAVSKTRPAKCGETPKTVEVVVADKSARGKQFLDLDAIKHEKLSIFNKMTTTQERMIDALDNLRLSLNEKHIPNSPYDKSRRERNGFEFSVRFLRNFLYPLQSMTEALRATTQDQLNSLTSNEASHRVLSIFQLCLHALQTYRKQLQHFFIDQVPQKLSSLLEAVYNVTRLCLEKEIFDRNDTVINRLMDRCTLIHSFLENMQSKKFIEMQERLHKSTAGAKQVNANDYNLKMCMNDLNMYEPKLVPKPKSAASRNNAATAKRTFKPVGAATLNATTKNASKELPLPTPRKSIRNMRRLRRFPGANKNSNAAEQRRSTDMLVTNGQDDEISTCMQNLSEFGAALPNELAETLQSLVATTQEVLKENKGGKSLKENKSSAALNRAITDALKNITREEVRDVLEPWLERLGTALEQHGYTEEISQAYELFIEKLNDWVSEGLLNKVENEKRGGYIDEDVGDGVSIRSGDCTDSESAGGSDDEHAQGGGDEIQCGWKPQNGAATNAIESDDERDDYAFENDIDADHSDSSDDLDHSSLATENLREIINQVQNSRRGDNGATSQELPKLPLQLLQSLSAKVKEYDMEIEATNRQNQQSPPVPGRLNGELHKNGESFPPALSRKQFEEHCYQFGLREKQPSTYEHALDQQCKRKDQQPKAQPTQGRTLSKGRKAHSPPPEPNPQRQNEPSSDEDSISSNQEIASDDPNYPQYNAVLNQRKQQKKAIEDAMAFRARLQQHRQQREKMQKRFEPPVLVNDAQPTDPGKSKHRTKSSGPVPAVKPTTASSNRPLSAAQTRLAKAKVSAGSTSQPGQTARTKNLLLHKKRHDFMSTPPPVPPTSQSVSRHSSASDLTELHLNLNSASAQQQAAASGHNSKPPRRYQSCSGAKEQVRNHTLRGVQSNLSSHMRSSTSAPASRTALREVPSKTKGPALVEDSDNESEATHSNDNVKNILELVHSGRFDSIIAKALQEKSANGESADFATIASAVAMATAGAEDRIVTLNPKENPYAAKTHKKQVEQPQQQQPKATKRSSSTSGFQSKSSSGTTSAAISIQKPLKSSGAAASSQTRKMVYSEDSINHPNATLQELQDYNPELPDDIDEDSLMHERDKFLSMCLRSPFYTNPNFPEPWKVLRQVSDRIADEAVVEAEGEFFEGLSNFVDDFLDKEIKM